VAVIVKASGSDQKEEENMLRRLQIITGALIATASFASCIGGNLPSRPGSGADAAFDSGDPAPAADAGAESPSTDVPTAAAMDTGGGDLSGGNADAGGSDQSNVAPDTAPIADADIPDAPALVDGLVPDTHTSAPDACGGCLTADGQCRPGTELGACGKAGGACLSCDDGQACTQDRCTAGQCFADPLSGGSCPGGICRVGACGCGMQGEPCCSTDPACQGVLACQAGTCGTCGGPGQPCCPGATACAAGTVCGGTPARCTACGDLDQPCCAGTSACRHGVCNAATSTCKPCGGQGQACCAGDTCAPDTNLCNGNEVCQAGVCGRTSAVTCPATDVCHEQGTCDPTSGLCSAGAPKSSGTCDDGNACTVNDSCSAGICAGTMMACAAPPAPTCANPTTRRTYTSPGTCGNGTCSYQFNDTPCAGACTAGTCTMNDSWTATTTGFAPTARHHHSAVWTGSKMIVWGGGSDCNNNYEPQPLAGATLFGTGAIYDPDTNTWTALPTANAPSPRTCHVSLWTGTEMIIFGGIDGTSMLKDGARYSPATNTWTPMALPYPVSAGGAGQTGIWTGTEMLIPGVGAGTAYNPSTDHWRNLPGTQHDFRFEYGVVWTGTEMIVWGGAIVLAHNPYVQGDGYRYNPTTDAYMALNTDKAPTPRRRQVAFWMGNEMIIWGGIGQNGTDNSAGARYNPALDLWTTVPKTNVVLGEDVSGVWTGAEMIVWGGGFDTGGRYAPGTGVWTPTSTVNAPSARHWNSAVWTGTQMIIWGGSGSGSLNTGSRYRP
jgi:N-acetylneuraminic acid mutarotase